ncbi:hypothetical protein RFI_12123 [Reticulomyxa filosa]|uniref:Uncharacterized protein n=1 Tax=Reticulomyxa filosa TaxID=46433 RepID=X6NFC7_RETFI|nr:hypothetical protein RFI_12123 [Reticulomyxa filosa]|eukprot:ETO25020.1 hypothetical protein RFI_12123 [Reticulomyxa filosa]
MSVRIVQDVLYVLLDFEGLCSFERSQEDVFLSVFNASMSNCTIFECENGLDKVTEVFQVLQRGVGLIKGSDKCFQGGLLLVIKDVVKSKKKEQAIANLVRHIKAYCDASNIEANGENMESDSFLTQMYKGSVRIETYPPLANKNFFRNLALFRKDVDDVPAVHRGGRQFLSHMKLVMSKLSVQDWRSLSGETVKMQIDELKDYINAAVKAGTLPTLDGSKASPGSINHRAILMKAMEKAAERNANAIELIQKENLEVKLLKALSNVGDEGLILGSVPSQKYLWVQFEAVVMKRSHDNWKHCVHVFQLWLDTIHLRREMRVLQWLQINTSSIITSKDEQDIVSSFVMECQIRLQQTKEAMLLCKQRCDTCNYSCMLHKGHEQDAKHARHDCWNEQDGHKCGVICDYCRQNIDKDKSKDKKNGTSEALPCGLVCGHEGQHDCMARNHCCGQPCSLLHLGNCQGYCTLEPLHSNSLRSHMCTAKVHYCGQPCSLPGCKDKCIEDHSVPHRRHWCGERRCPGKCQVKCRSNDTGEVAFCGAQCHSEDHFHNCISQQNIAIKHYSDEERHICCNDHLCPEYCTSQGICEIVATSTLQNQPRDACGKENVATFQYEGQRKFCAIRIPSFQFRHSNSKDHVCYTPHVCDKLNCKHVLDDPTHSCTTACGCTHFRKQHHCDIKCPSCGYFCERPYGHPEAIFFFFSFCSIYFLEDKKKKKNIYIFFFFFFFCNNRICTRHLMAIYVFLTL